jgi:hypothetical protein
MPNASDFGFSIAGQLPTTEPAWGEYMSEGERRMAEALVDQCVSRGLWMAVYDGGEFVTFPTSSEDERPRRTLDKGKVLAALGSTDQDQLNIGREEDGRWRKTGMFLLVYGNSGHELVADYSLTPICEEIWDALEPVRAELEAAEG